MSARLRDFAIAVALLIPSAFASAQGGGGGMMDDKMAPKMDAMSDAMMASAMFRGAGEHPAAGRYNIAVEKGKVMLSTSADFARDAKAPDVYLVLAKGTAVTKANGVWLGKVNKATGAHRFVIPADAKIDGYDTVVLWCKKFNALMGSAPLDAQALAKLRSSAMSDKMDGMMDGKMDHKMSKPPTAP